MILRLAIVETICTMHVRSLKLKYLGQNIPELAMAATGGDLKSRIHRAVGQHSCAPRYGNQWLAALAAVLVVPSIFTASKVIAMTQTEPVITPPFRKISKFMVLDAKLNQTQKTQPVSKDVKKDTVIISELATEEDLTAQTFENDVTAVTESSAVEQTKKPALAQQKEVVSQNATYIRHIDVTRCTKN